MPVYAKGAGFGLTNILDTCVQRLAFEGGVAGTIDYLMFTKLISRPGWLISLSVGFISLI
jgi:hypothetical protein